MATPIEPLYIADTHALLWYLLGDKKLSSTAASIFNAAEQAQTHIVFSVISLAELYYTQRKYTLPQDFAATCRDLHRRPYFQIVVLEYQHLLDFDVLSAVPEMHDKIIVGLAQRLAAPLLTTDPVIRSSGLVRIVW